MQVTPMPKTPKEYPETQVTPNPELERRTRRVFTADYKLRIIAEADACQHGQLGALLRREKLYSNQLSAWRKEYADKGIKGLSKSVPGPSPSKTSEQKRIEQLERQNLQLKKKLDIAQDCLDLQKKALSMLDRIKNGSDA